MVYGMSQNSEG